MNQCLEAVWEWMSATKLKFNPSKTKMLQMDVRSDLGFKMPPIWDGIPLPLKEQVCSPGLLMYQGLLLDKQVATVTKNAFYQF